MGVATAPPCGKGVVVERDWVWGRGGAAVDCGGRSGLCVEGRKASMEGVELEEYGKEPNWVCGGARPVEEVGGRWEARCKGRGCRPP